MSPLGSPSPGFSSSPHRARRRTAAQGSSRPTRTRRRRALSLMPAGPDTFPAWGFLSDDSRACSVSPTLRVALAPSAPLLAPRRRVPRPSPSPSPRSRRLRWDAARGRPRPRPRSLAFQRRTGDSPRQLTHAPWLGASYSGFGASKDFVRVSWARAELVLPLARWAGCLIRCPSGLGGGAGRGRARTPP